MYRLCGSAVALLRRRQFLQSTSCSLQLAKEQSIVSSGGGGGSFLIWTRQFAARARQRKKSAKKTRVFGAPPPRPTGQPAPRHKRHFAYRPRKFSLQDARKVVQGWDKIALRLGLREGDEEAEWKSRNERKRECLRAVAMTKVLVTFTHRKIRDAIKFAFLPNQTFQATLLYQKMKMEGLREAKRRQYMFIASLLRKSEITLVEFVINSMKDGHSEKVRKVIESVTTTQRDKQVKLATERWIQGILTGDKSILDEVYAIPSEYLDKHQFKQLLRDVKVQASRKNQAECDAVHGGFMHGKLWRARKALGKLLKNAVIYDLSSRDLLPKPDMAMLEELEVSQDMEVRSFLSQTAGQALDTATLVEETGCRPEEANALARQAARQEREAMAMVEEAVYEDYNKTEDTEEQGRCLEDVESVEMYVDGKDRKEEQTK